MRTYAAIIGLYLGAISACITLLILGLIVLGNHPQPWATNWWHMTMTWALAGCVLLRVSRAIYRRTEAPRSSLGPVSARGSITIADPQLKRVLRQMALLAFVTVTAFAALTWIITPRSFQLGNEVESVP